MCFSIEKIIIYKIDNYYYLLFKRLTSVVTCCRWNTNPMDMSDDSNVTLGLSMSSPD